MLARGCSPSAGLGTLAVVSTWRWAVPVLFVTAACAPSGSASPVSRLDIPSFTQPKPPISASAFALEPAGVAPADGDGRIPNPTTPAGAPIQPPQKCSIIFDSAKGATSAMVNGAIAAGEDVISTTYVICLAGTFTSPIHVWDKYSPALLVIAPEPGHSAQLRLGHVKAGDVDPNDYDGGVVGGVTIADSRGVEVYGLSISGYTTYGPNYTPAGIYVTVRQSGSVAGKGVPHESPCFVRGDKACGDIYLLDDTVAGITNSADNEAGVTKAMCGNSGVGAYGIAILSHGSDTAHALQHVVVEGDTVDHVRTGQSETLTVNGDVSDFLVAGDKVFDTDNIGIDAIGWEEGSDQARHGLILSNLVANVDTWGNASYGSWNGKSCTEQPENAAGVYVDGASYIWIDHNTVWNSDQGIDLDVETANRYTDHLLVTGNAVVDGRGTTLADPSTGADPAGIPEKRSTVAGHDYVALYIDSYGAGSFIEDVYVHDNTFFNESQYYGATSRQVGPVVDLAGNWANVMIWRDTVAGGGGSDALNPLLELDTQPRSGSADFIDCNAYERLTTNPANGDFVLPNGNSYITLGAWVANNGHGFDGHSVVAAKSSCPVSVP
jgi:hypothetical protein